MYICIYIHVHIYIYIYTYYLYIYRLHRLQHASTMVMNHFWVHCTHPGQCRGSSLATNVGAVLAFASATSGDWERANKGTNRGLKYVEMMIQYLWEWRLRYVSHSFDLLELAGFLDHRLWIKLWVRNSCWQWVYWFWCDVDGFIHGFLFLLLIHWFDWIWCFFIAPPSSI